ncbi:RNase H, partial [Vibrio anguillarum]|nr:RNase H [Vibrio anguillarum]
MAKNNFYAVLYGRRTGVFSSWDEVKKYTHGYG